MSFKQCQLIEHLCRIIENVNNSVYPNYNFFVSHINTRSGKYMIYFLLISNPVDTGYNDILLYAKYSSIRPLVYHIAGCATRDISAQMYQKVDINDAKA